MKKIYITGVARSGTTLLLRLMNAFKETIGHVDEITLDDFVRYSRTAPEPPTQAIFGKRSMGHIFSHLISTKEIANQWAVIRKNEFEILHVVRDGRDVVASQYEKWGVNNPIEWITCNDLARKYANAYANVTTIKYEDIVSQPDKIQALVASHYGLKIVHKWSEYPDWLDEDLKALDEYLLRKISRKTRDHLAWYGSGMDLNYLQQKLKSFGYE